MGSAATSAFRRAPAPPTLVGSAQPRVNFGKEGKKDERKKLGSKLANSIPFVESPAQMEQR